MGLLGAIESASTRPDFSSCCQISSMLEQCQTPTASPLHTVPLSREHVCAGWLIPKTNGRVGHVFLRCADLRRVSSAVSSQLPKPGRGKAKRGQPLPSTARPADHQSMMVAVLWVCLRGAARLFHPSDVLFAHTPGRNRPLHRDFSRSRVFQACATARACMQQS